MTEKPDPHVDALWKHRYAGTVGLGSEAVAVVTRDDLDDLARDITADALTDAATTVHRTLTDEYFTADGKAEEWTDHRRKVWAEGAAAALAAVRRRGEQLRRAVEGL